MAVETPPHTQRFGLSNFFHGRDVTVTSGAIDRGANVNRVVEERVIRKIVHPDPSDGLAGRHAVAKGLECLTVACDETMAIHARLRRRKRCHRRYLDARVTVAAIDLELAGVQCVAERNRLTRHVADVGICRGESIPSTGREQDRTSRPRQKDEPRRAVHPRRKDLSHGSFVTPNGVPIYEPLHAPARKKRRPAQKTERAVHFLALAEVEI